MYDYKKDIHFKNILNYLILIYFSTPYLLIIIMLIDNFFKKNEISKKKNIPKIYTFQEYYEKTGNILIIDINNKIYIGEKQKN